MGYKVVRITEELTWWQRMLFVNPYKEYFEKFCKRDFSGMKFLKKMSSGVYEREVLWMSCFVSF